MYYMHDIYFKMLKVDSTAFYHECQAMTRGVPGEKKGVAWGMKGGQQQQTCLQRKRPVSFDYEVNHVRRAILK